MSFLIGTALDQFGFKRLGIDVRISNKASIINPELMEIGDNVRIDDFCVISGKIEFGRNVHVSVMCNMAGGQPGIICEDFVGMSYGVHVFSQSDDYSGATLTNPTVPSAYKNEYRAQVVIKRHSIVGACSVIMPGVVLEEGTAVGAMSLVTKSTEPWSIYVGIPAKRLKARKRDLLKLESAYLQEEAERLSGRRKE